jgi:glycine hydroxymethyltransferase
MVLCKAERAQAIDKTVFPGLQGGPLMHVIAGKAVCFGEALQPSFKEYASAIVANAKVLAGALLSGGLKLVSGGTDNHLMLVDVTPLNIGGKLATEALERCGITVNMNMIPFDLRKPLDPSGIRLGTPALTTRGMGTDEMRRVGRWILDALKAPDDLNLHGRIRGEISSLCQQFPVPAAAIAAV